MHFIHIIGTEFHTPIIDLVGIIISGGVLEKVRFTIIKIACRYIAFTDTNTTFQTSPINNSTIGFRPNILVKVAIKHTGI
ncbi:hypothetical protein D3C75_1191330 [compost metagenome]